MSPYKNVLDFVIIKFFCVGLFYISLKSLVFVEASKKETPKEQPRLNVFSFQWFLDSSVAELWTIFLLNQPLFCLLPDSIAASSQVRGSDVGISRALLLNVYSQTTLDLI